MSVMGFQKKSLDGGMGGCGEVYPSFFGTRGIFFNIAKPLSSSSTRAVVRLVWPSILVLIIERWRHLADSNEPNFINK